MPGSVSVFESPGQPQFSTDADFGVCVVGAASTSPVTAGQLTPAYGTPDAAVTDLGLGDAVDVLCHAIKVTPGNPAPTPASFYRTPATTPGVRGTVDQSGVTGTAVITASAGATPLGTYEPVVRVVDDGASGAGCAIGAAGLVLQGSLDGGRTWLPAEQLGTATSWAIKLYVNGSLTSTGVQYDLEPASSDKTALYTKLNTFAGVVAAHFTTTTGSPQVHAASDTTDNTALVAIASATTPATAVTKFNGILSLLGTHGASATYHTAADAALATALAAIQVAVDVEDVELHLGALITAYNAHRVNVTSVHGTADSTNTITAFTAAPGVLHAGDTWGESKTTPPMFGASDLYTAGGGTASGALAAIADSSQLFGIVCISEPIVDANYNGTTHTGTVFSTLVAGLDYAAQFNKRWLLLCRFRDPQAGETDAQYIAAFDAFCAANHDSRIEVRAGSLYVTDAYRGFTYLRSHIGPLLARYQSFVAVAGQEGERLAQNPGWVARGPLESASLKDAAGNTIGHDEALRGGIDASPGAATGRGGSVYYLRDARLAGTYASNRGTVMYGPGSSILTPMDRRVANALETVAVSVATESIGGADIYDTDPQTQVSTLDTDIRDGIATKIAGEILSRYPREFQNATDPGLVTIDPTVTINGQLVTMTGTLRPKLYGYTDTIALKFSATR